MKRGDARSARPRERQARTSRGLPGPAPRGGTPALLRRRDGGREAQAGGERDELHGAGLISPAPAPNAGSTLQELEEVIVEGTEIQSLQDVQRSELRETNRRSREVRRRGRSLRNKLAAGVQSVFGVDSMALLAFGVKPRLQKPRRRLPPDEKSSSWKRSSRR